MPSVATLLAATLKEFGIDRVFGLPGGENVAVVDALRAARIEFVLVHDESSAVFMADVYARLTGTIGVCLTTLGPGATNATVGVAHAYLDRAPVLVLTAQMPDALRPHHTHQFVDLHALFAPITKATLNLEPTHARSTIHRALELARAPRPGPVHLQITNDDARANVADTDVNPNPVRTKNPVGQNDEALRALIARARRPLILAGLGLEPERPYDALRALAEKSRAPVIVTPKAKGALPDDHPLAAGTLGLTRTDPVYEILEQADLILAVGFDVVELVKPWAHAAPLVWIANWANEDPKLDARAEWVGAITPTLEQLAAMEWYTADDWGEARVAKHRARFSLRESFEPRAGEILPQTFLRALRDASPRDVILTTDVGSHKIFYSLYWQTFAPNSFFVSNGLSSMGFALPAALAARLAEPNRVVIGTMGDAGLLMMLGELGLVKRVGGKMIVVVFNDGALDLIRAQQIRAGKETYGTEFVSPDFVRVAEGFGIAARRVTNEKECADAIQFALARDEPTLIEVRVDGRGYESPRQLEARGQV